MAAFGVSVSPLPTGEVYSALDKGVIDGADRGDLTANFDAGLAEVAKHVVLPGDPASRPRRRLYVARPSRSRRAAGRAQRRR